jgi:Family of unknown function (DUF6090)
MTDNKISRYFLYAFGEIVLVVIGILIALQINNWNDKRIQRSKEIQYLKNIRKDLKLNISELEKYIKDRTSQIESANLVLEYFEGKPLTDPELLYDHAVNIYTWKLYFQTNNTFQELINTGNLAVISNDSIRNALLDLESLYQVMKAEEGHFRYDSEVTLFEPAYRTQDTNKLLKNFVYRATNGQQGRSSKIKSDDLKLMLSDLKQKNGFVMATFELSVIKEQLEQMKTSSEKLIQLVDDEIN